ncbi:MAG: hypothetical protein LBR51_05945 [Bacteroidales bacterium]|jgi:tetratricopeptide (TPR) repeat protein|nr:hypothetical protein [Bacteroidales bacterium]
MKKIGGIFFLFLLYFAAVAQPASEEQIGIQYYLDGEYEKASEVFAKIYNKKSNSYIYYYYYPTLLALSDYKELEKLVKKQMKSLPDAQRFKVDLGYVYERGGDHIKAEKEYENAIKELPATEPATRELYEAFLSRARKDYAVQTLLRGRQLLKNQKLFSTELTTIYLALNQPEKVIEEAISLVSNDESIVDIANAETILQNLLLEDDDNTNYLAIKSILLKHSQKSPDNHSYPALLLWVYKLHKDYAAALLLAKSMDRREKGNGELVYDLARDMIRDREYVTAIEALNYVMSKGVHADYYIAARQTLLDVKYRQLTEKTPVKKEDALALEQEFKVMFDETGIQPDQTEWLQKYAHLMAFYADKTTDAIALLNKAIDLSSAQPKIKAIYKVDLADLLLYAGNVWDATLLYSQVEKDFPNDTIGQLAKYRNAKLSFYIGEFAWAKSQLDVLKSATTKLIANDAMYFSLLISDNEDDNDEEDDEEEDTTDGDTLLFSQKHLNEPLRYYAKADFARFQQCDEAALLLLDTVLQIAPFGKLTDDVYYQKAQIAIRQQKYMEAEQWLLKLLSGYAGDILGDDATFLLAELYDYYLKDLPRAMEYYQKLMKDYPGSLHVIAARKRYRTLRGDNLN